MKYISLTTVILSVAVIVGADPISQNPIGLPCNNPGDEACGTITDYNSGFPFVYTCAPQNTVNHFVNCPCATCCVIDGHSGLCTFP
ncbi:hypothetical protein K503DRAFT_692270 [Rhizopogon vinicolor AM-OR11-026]|uniref:Chitin-binding type-2 domain-containing protein n=1 Tax=Rhizopogon vinicolor AM-OR11-026 TaxID=1314800 RepID=A0A1B7MZK7_9AGAM|nr:hypothetical protein K503DRAFT_692270 [Rhizopogon vinicolor AM-OR11-026]